MRLKLDDVIYWVASVGPGNVKEREAMYFKGQWDRNCADGLRGDVKARPVRLGEGEFTATYGRDAFETADGTPIRF